RLGRDDLQVVEEYGAGKLRPVADEKARLQADEGDGAIRPHGLADRHACVAVQAGRNVHLEHRASGIVDITDYTRGLLARGSMKPRAPQRIADPLPLDQPRRRVRVDLSA